MERNSINSANLAKDPVCYLYLTGTVVTSWSLTQEVVSLNNPFNYKDVLSLISENSVKTFRENSNTIALIWFTIDVRWSFLHGSGRNRHFLHYVVCWGIGKGKYGTGWLDRVYSIFSLVMKENLQNSFSTLSQTQKT